MIRAAPAVAAAALAVWFVVGLSSSSAQWGDHFEQFVWAHGIEWGYHKHPPLPTWILAAVIRLFGPSIGSAQVLAVVCALGTGFFTYRLAKELFGPSVAALALLFWGLQQPFSNRSHLFNHNSVMMLSISATAWALVHATRRPDRSRRWLAVGLLAGLSVLAKYQAVVPLAGLVLAAWLAGELDSKDARFGLAAAASTAIAVVAPHAIWLVQYGSASIGYAVQQGESLSWPGRAWSVTSFLAQQVRLVGPALALAALLVHLPRWTEAHAMAPSNRERSRARMSRRQRAWLIGLIVFPLGMTVLVSPLFGLRLQNHWGYQALQFGSIGLAWYVRSRTTSPRAAWIALAVLVHLVFLGLALQLPPPAAARLDARYPARELADATRRDWQDDTACPLAFVVGPSFEAGIVSVYNGGTARVLEDGEHAKSPWVSRSELQARGAVYVAADPAKLPTAGVTRTGSLDVSAASPAPNDRVHWAIVPPERCDAID